MAASLTNSCAIDYRRNAGERARMATVFSSNGSASPEICFGAIVTFLVAILFRTGREHHPPNVFNRNIDLEI
jgi:hypothetical protein